MTCEPLTADLGVALLTWFQEVSLARIFPQPEKAKASMEAEADSGKNLPVSLAKYDPTTHSLRTRQCLLFEEGTELLATLPEWGMTAGGELYPLPTPEHLTEGSGSGLWPTPNVCGGGNPPSLLIPNGNHFVRKSGKKAHLGLDQAVKIWPTPTARDFRSGKGRTQVERGRTAGSSLAEVSGGSLNPTWVEWLMGWPLGWTALDACLGNGQVPICAAMAWRILSNPQR
jgi:hypothetical protein